jgi:hypothetical protein
MLERAPRACAEFAAWLRERKGGGDDDGVNRIIRGIADELDPPKTAEQEGKP